MKTIYVITGGSSGLGKAMINILMEEKSPCIIVSISRNLSEDQKEMISKDASRFIFISADLGVPIDLSLLSPIKDVCEKIEEIIFINNAAVVNPIGILGEYKQDELIQAININVVSPVLIANYLIGEFNNKKLVIVNISSGAAKHPIEGLATYCSSKSFALMFFEVFNLQVKENPNIDVFSIDPGVIDTGMQTIMRNAPSLHFTKKKDFQQLHINKKLQSPRNAARKLLEDLGFI